MHCCERYEDVEDFGYEYCPFCGNKPYKIVIEGYSDLLRVTSFLKHRPVEEWTEGEWFAYIAYRINESREIEKMNVNDIDVNSIIPFSSTYDEEKADDLLKKLEKENKKVEEGLQDVFAQARNELQDMEKAKEKWKPKRKGKPSVLTESAIQQLNEEWQRFVKEKQKKLKGKLPSDIFSILSAITFRHVDFFGTSNLYRQFIFELHELTFTVKEKEYVLHSMFYPPDMPEWFEFSGEDELFQEIFGVDLDSQEGRWIKQQLFHEFYFQNRIEDIAPSNPELKQKYGRGWIY